MQEEASIVCKTRMMNKVGEDHQGLCHINCTNLAIVGPDLQTFAFGH